VTNQRPSVRLATLDDIETLVALMCDFYSESSYELDRTWAANSFRTLLSNAALGCVWLAVADAQSVGHAVLTVRYTMEHGALSAYIDDLYVVPHHRNCGTGAALLGELFNEMRARGCKSAHVEVGDTNDAARALYAKFGLSAAQDGRVLLSRVLPTDADD
jgi:ribosomal protein S18 acetylase RimI-like enzyme